MRAKEQLKREKNKEKWDYIARERGEPMFGWREKDKRMLQLEKKSPIRWDTLSNEAGENNLTQQIVLLFKFDEGIGYGRWFARSCFQ